MPKSWWVAEVPGSGQRTSLTDIQDGATLEYRLYLTFGFRCNTWQIDTPISDEVHTLFFSGITASGRNPMLYSQV